MVPNGSMATVAIGATSSSARSDPVTPSRSDLVHHAPARPRFGGCALAASETYVSPGMPYLMIPKYRSLVVLPMFVPRRFHVAESDPASLRNLSAGTP